MRCHREGRIMLRPPHCGIGDNLGGESYIDIRPKAGPNSRAQSTAGSAQKSCGASAQTLAENASLVGAVS